MKGKWMLKLSVLLVLLMVGSTMTISHGQVVWIDGGLVGDKMISGTYEYQELCFITGEPVMLRGTVTLPTIPVDKDKYSLKYTFALSNPQKGIALTRSLTFEVTKTPSVNIKQTAVDRKLTQYTETITTPEGEYTLGKYIYTNSRIEDNTPAVDYFSGNVIAERTYYLNGDYLENEGYVTYIMDARPIVGFDHYFGESETVVVKQEIQSYKPNPAYDPAVYGSQEFIAWTGTVDIGMSSNKTVKFEYQYTDPQSISFRGSYFKITSEDNVLTYDYNLPMTSNGTVDMEATRRNVGDVNMSKNVILESKALVTPKIRDIGGHWAEDTIFKLTSLEVFAVDKEYFVPAATISRLDFGKAMVVALYGPLPKPTSTDVIRRMRPGVDTPFLDVLPTDPDYHYIEFIKNKDLMSGTNSYFQGDKPLTRSEAIAIMIRALGLQYMAPAPPYTTQFTDDRAIQEWARDYIYVANEIGLINGTDEGYVNPNRNVRKDEAAGMIDNLINHMKDYITYDYREKILNR